MADAKTTDAFDKAARMTGRKGFAILLSADGKGAEIVPLGDVETSLAAPDSHGFAEWFNPGPSKNRHDETKQMVEEAEAGPYTQMGEHHFETAKAESHERARKAGNNFPVKSHEGKNPVGDAVLVTRQLQAQRETTHGKLKQARDARMMRRFAQDQYARNESFAETQKAFWQKKSA